MKNETKIFVADLFTKDLFSDNVNVITDLQKYQIKNNLIRNLTDETTTDEIIEFVKIDATYHELEYYKFCSNDFDTINKNIAILYNNIISDIIETTKNRDFYEKIDIINKIIDENITEYNFENNDNNIDDVDAKLFILYYIFENDII